MASLDRTYESIEEDKDGYFVNIFFMCDLSIHLLNSVFEGVQSVFLIEHFFSFLCISHAFCITAKKSA